MVGAISLCYNLFVFYLFDFYPDIPFEIGFLADLGIDSFVVILIKNVLVGILLMVLFSIAYTNIQRDKGGTKEAAKGIIFFILYALTALVSFSIGDMFLMRTDEGMLILLTLDGWVETIIATVAIRLFH